MSQKSFKERLIPSNDDNPETINELVYNENIFNKEVLTQDHIDNYSIGGSPDMSKRIEIDIRDLKKPLKLTEINHKSENKNSNSKSNLIFFQNL